jgi:uncharacterized protein
MPNATAMDNKPTRTEAFICLNDGVRLSADIYYPEAPGNYPVLLMRQPYAREIASTVVYAQPDYFARRGFIVVIQDVRGRGQSEGVFYPFRNEARDGFETIQWASALPGSDGRVCMYGFSYQGYTQLAALEDKPPALVAIAPHMTAANLYHGWFYHNGILRQHTTLSWANQMLREDAWRSGAYQSAKQLEAAFAAGTLCHQLPISNVTPLTEADIPSYYSDWVKHIESDDYWTSLDTSAALAAADIPVFHLAGYYDYYSRGSIQTYQARRDHVNDDFFILGPWKHIPWERWNGDFDFGPNARIDTDALLVEWFDQCLGRREPNLKGVRYYVVGKDEWFSAPCWPPSSQPLELYLSATAPANSLFGGGRLRTQVSETPPDSFCYDPQVPVYAPGGMAANFGPIDLKFQQQGNNLLVYESEAFEQKVIIAGHARLIIFFSSSACDTDCVARLSWVRMDKRALFICLAAGSLRHFDRASSGDCYCLDLEFEAFALALEPGDRLRLDVSSSAFPLLARHPNTETPRTAVHSEYAFERARQIVYHDKQRPSRLILPVTHFG